MTQDEIIEMAREAGFVEYELDDGTTTAFDKRYQTFAKLVAAKEREALAQTQEPVALQYPQKDIDWQREQQIKAQASTPPQGIYYTPPQQELVCVCGAVWDGQELMETPPQRTWVDLTRTQMQDVYFAVLEEHRGGHQMEGQLAFGEALQAKIREKNT